MGGEPPRLQGDSLFPAGPGSIAAPLLRQPQAVPARRAPRARLPCQLPSWVTLGRSLPVGGLRLSPLPLVLLIAALPGGEQHGWGWRRSPNHASIPLTFLRGCLFIHLLHSEPPQQLLPGGLRMTPVPLGPLLHPIKPNQAPNFYHPLQFPGLNVISMGSHAL